MDKFSLLLKLTALFFLLLLSAFFSGSETALFSLGKIKAKELKDKRVLQLLEKPRQLLINLLVGNTLVNLFACGLATSIVLSICKEYHISKSLGVSFSIISMTVIILIVGEIGPKNFAFFNAEKVAKGVAYPIRLFSFLVSPLRRILLFATNLILSILERKKGKEPFVTDEEIKDLVRVGKEEGVIAQDEVKMLDGIFRFSETSAAKVMTPREKMVSLDLHSSKEDLLDLVKKTGYSRIPVHKDSIDHIVGTIHAKDLLIQLGKKGRVNLSRLLRDVVFVGMNEPIDELLKVLQRRRIQVAVVRNKNRRTMGIVTMEDIIEEIVGEIEDEYD